MARTHHHQQQQREQQDVRNDATFVPYVAQANEGAIVPHDGCPTAAVQAIMENILQKSHS
eukprot:scaffold4847_cov89-Cylindrotheca_fusiformis.AAC.11